MKPGATAAFASHLHVSRVHYDNRKAYHREKAAKDYLTRALEKTTGGTMFQRFCVILSLGLCLANLALGQSSTGTIQGLVADAQGAVIPEASVTVTNLGTNHSIIVKTNSDGLFSLPALDPGSFKVEVEETNFATTTQQVTLQTAQVVNLEFKLQPGSSSQVVEVTAGAPIIDTSTSGVSDTVVGRQLTDLPLNGRNFTDLAALVPGVTRGQPGNTQTGTGNQAEPTVVANHFLKQRSQKTAPSASSVTIP